METVDLTKLYGVKISTKRGHCAKTDAILKYFIKYYDMKKYLVIVDDDTLLSITRLIRVLNSYNASTPLYIGERYGYGHRASEISSSGYDYVTMGGGVALSRKAIELRSRCLRCTCPREDTPDDMQMGLWMRYLGIPVSHEGGFHQSEPHNYHENLLNHYPAVSFHRFEKSIMTGDIDPEKTKEVYDRYLKVKKEEQDDPGADATKANDFNDDVENDASDDGAEPDASASNSDASSSTSSPPSSSSTAAESVARPGGEMPPSSSNQAQPKLSEGDTVVPAPTSSTTRDDL
mmetsp:Transcript_8677/g.16441  ORF Transcript_8677/g.16441 Transcript_8677/m.16441 type:complete len:290 (-) Transcript_8677:230-1099(-)